MTRRTDASWCLFGTAAIGSRLAALAREAECVRQGDDPECVHRMRVAARRLNSALRLFEECLPARRLRAWNKRIRRLRRALGAARDTDVQIAFVGEFLQRLRGKRARPGVERLLLRLRQKREALQADVVQAMDQLRSSRVLREMRARLKQIRGAAKGGGAGPRSARVYDRARAAVALRLRGLLGYEPYLRRPGCVDKHHAMRIAAKHLRYTMEIFKELYADQLKEPLRAARGAQTLLGELHDTDVWIAYLPLFVAQERERTRGYFGGDRPFKPLEAGLRRLEQDCRTRRGAKHKELLAFWDGLKEEGVWERLRQAIEHRLLSGTGCREGCGGPHAEGRELGRRRR